MLKQFKRYAGPRGGTGQVHHKHIGDNMSSCCTRKRTWKDFMFLPMAVGFAVLGLVFLLGIEMGIAYALGYVDPSVFMMGLK